MGARSRGGKKKLKQPRGVLRALATPNSPAGYLLKAVFSYDDERKTEACISVYIKEMVHGVLLLRKYEQHGFKKDCARFCNDGGGVFVFRTWSLGYLADRPAVRNVSKKDPGIGFGGLAHGSRIKGGESIGRR